MENKKSKSIIVQEDWFRENGYKLNQYPDDFYKHVEDELKPPIRAYFAMLIDGDGSISDRKNKGGVYMQIELTTREPIQYLADVYGSSISVRQHQNNDAWRDMYSTRLQGKRFHHFAKLICPYMSEKKQHLIKIINKTEPNYHPPKIPMDFKKDPGTITTHMGMVAGLFDSEGSVGIKTAVKKYKGKNGVRLYNVLIQWIHFTNTNLRLLRKIKKILESWPFTFRPKIYKHQDKKQLKKNGELKKIAYKLQIPTNHHLLFMALFSPILMIEEKKQVDRFKDLKMVNERFFTGGKWSSKRKAS